MIDIHNHILPNIDDGSRSLVESICMIQKLVGLGFDKIIVTPHYIEGSTFQVNNRKKEQILKQLQQEVKKRDIQVQLFLGNEVYIHNNLLKNLKKENIACLNNSQYLLIELPMQNQIVELDTILFNCLVEGITPIIAHPERYRYFQEDYSKLHLLLEKGILFQGNYGSLIDYYGKPAKKTLEYMLKHHMISFLGTDIHRDEEKLHEAFPKIKKKIIKWIGEDSFKKITIDNPQKVITNKKINH